jgi:hypothetical protein
MVVASSRGISLGLATSNQAGSFTDGRIGAGAATIGSSPLPCTKGRVDKEGTLTLGHLQGG